MIRRRNVLNIPEFYVGKNPHNKYTITLRLLFGIKNYQKQLLLSSADTVLFFNASTSVKLMQFAVLSPSILLGTLVQFDAS